MFKQRLLTTLLLVPLIILAIFYAPNIVLLGILLLILTLCGFEWAKLIPIETKMAQILYIVGLLGMAVLLSFEFPVWLTFGILAWLGVFIAVATFPKSQFFWGYSLLVGISGLFFLSIFFNSFIGIHQFSHGKGLVIYILCLVWAADTGGYLVGKSIGRRKIIPRVSPGKTLEGCVGGILSSLVVAIIGYILLKPTSSIQWFLLAFGTALISILGDLFISMLKRRCHLKDSGQLIPGHGGILDRLDSSIAAFPFFYLGLLFLEFTS